MVQDDLITHKYAIGGATHWAIGAFVDGQGADHYRNSGDDECIGIGYDASVAFHIDRGAEDDTYDISRAECVNGSTWIQTDPDGPDWTPTYDFGYGYDGE